jgi:hypothetical protein
MGLSRLDNFLKSARGTILYVDPNSIDSTDSIENQGNSLTRPFRTLQRALVEASRFSYQKGLNNDRFEKTTIVLYPGDHVVDNRPGWIPNGTNNYLLRNGSSSSDISPFDFSSNFDLTTPTNDLYKLNSVYGGVIIPRGTSIIGMDLRKTRIRPLYVPNPENDSIERSAVFRVTGGCYFWQFSVFDADPNGNCYKDYTTNRFVPNFSHHKLTTFEYADGANNVSIDDDFISNFSADRTDLDMYYEKVGLFYGDLSGRNISPDYPSSSLDIQTKVDEYRIVGSRGAEVGITSIRAGDGTSLGKTTTITVDIDEELEGLDVDTPIRIQGVGAVGYDGQFVVSESVSSTQVQYEVQNVPVDPLPSVTGATLNLSVDTVTSSSPYIFNVSLRSVYGMCGLHADGNKVSGFKSMVVAQFTGIGLQKDDKAFVKYNETTGTYEDSTTIANLHSDSLARFKPEYENYHIKSSNDSYLQLVSVFAIGYSNHFISESGGDQSINNSTSNFGANALVSKGFRSTAFPRDDVGYITHIIPPKTIESDEISVEYTAIDVDKTTTVGVSSSLYLYNQTNQDILPESVIEGYRIGAKVDDTINVLINNGGNSVEYSAKVVMPNTLTTSEKNFTVGRSSVGVNSITSNTITLTEDHTFENGESIRIISDNAHLPDGLSNNQIYYAITSGLNANELKVSNNLNDAISLSAIDINSNGGILRVVSRVSDKKSGDIGHPIQYSSANQQWYINVSNVPADNTIYSTIVSLGTGVLGDATSRTYIKRIPDTRNIVDNIYRLRYVIPSDSSVSARPPLDGFILQESGSSIGTVDSEVDYLYNPNPVTISNSTELRNPRLIADASWSANVANITSEIPHDLTVGSQVKITNVTSANVPVAVENSGFNGTFTVTSVTSAKEFSVSMPLNSDPGGFTNNTSLRTTALPHFTKKNYSNTYSVYRTQAIQKYIPGEQDGIYHLFVINTSNSPTVSPYSSESFSQPIQNLYPQTNRDNPKSDPKSSVSFALPDSIGQVVIDDPQSSITRETLDKSLIDFNVGFGLTDVASNGSGTEHTFYSKIDHGLNQVVSVNIDSAGSGYGVGSGSVEYYYNAELQEAGSSTTGRNATARVTVNPSGQITDVQIIDGGSAYGIGNTMTIVGTATTTGFTAAEVSVTQINSNVGDTLSLSGIVPSDYDEYNNLYRITSIPNDKSIVVSSASTVTPAVTSGLGVTVTADSNVVLTGKTLDISGLIYDNTTGLGIVTTTNAHGLFVDNVIRIGGADSEFYNGDFVIKEVTNLTTFVADFGDNTTTPVTTGTLRIFKPGFTSNGGNVTKERENIGGRLISEYAGITTTLSAIITDENATTIEISNVGNYNFQVGDYLQIDEEILRISGTVSGNPVSVFRGLLGTRKSTHANGSVIKRIKPRPIELRRNSLIKASGHTFEYLGFGPGNYSTAFPERQDRTITGQEELLAQSTKKDGGVVVFTGMSADGDFYVGNRKVSSTTGQEEVFDAPIPTVTGEDPGIGVNVGFDVLSPLEVSISRSIRVEGGTDASIISEFDGPIVVNNKLTSTSPKGIEANSIFLQGDRTVSRKYTVGIATPSLAGNPGDVVYNGVPTLNDYIGWVYTTNNQWQKFGYVGEFQDPRVGFSSDGTFIGITTNIDFRSGVGATITTQFDSNTGVSTVIFDASPLNVGVSTGLGEDKTFVGVATEINFIGYGVTIEASFNAGIASITFDGTGGGTGSPGAPLDSIQFNNSGFFGGSSNFTFDGTDVFVGNSLGIGNASPTAKLDISATTTEALRITSTSGSGNIVRVNNGASDTTPFIVDVSGNVGVNTITATDALDVRGDSGVTGELKLYETDHSNYIGLNAPTLSANYNYTLPNEYGDSGNALKSDGSGVLSWGYASSENVYAGAGITITKQLITATGETQATVTNSGVTGLVAGDNVTISGATGDVTISATPITTTAPPYPFTTRGFSIPL